MATPMPQTPPDAGYEWYWHENAGRWVQRRSATPAPEPGSGSSPGSSPPPKLDDAFSNFAKTVKSMAPPPPTTPPEIVEQLKAAGLDPALYNPATGMYNMPGPRLASSGGGSIAGPSKPVPLNTALAAANKQIINKQNKELATGSQGELLKYAAANPDMVTELNTNLGSNQIGYQPALSNYAPEHTPGAVPKLQYGAFGLSDAEIDAFNAKYTQPGTGPGMGTLQTPSSPGGLIAPGVAQPGIPSPGTAPSPFANTVRDFNNRLNGIMPAAPPLASVGQSTIEQGLTQTPAPAPSPTPGTPQPAPAPAPAPAPVTQQRVAPQPTAAPVTATAPTASTYAAPQPVNYGNTAIPGKAPGDPVVQTQPAPQPRTPIAQMTQRPPARVPTLQEMANRLLLTLNQRPR